MRQTSLRFAAPSLTTQRLLSGALIAALGILASAPAFAAADVDVEPSYRGLKPPTFPQSAIDARQSGKAIVRVTVDTNGQPKAVELEASSGSAALDQAALTAVKGWSFNPAQQGGKAVSADVLVPVCFALDDGEPECEAGENSLDGIWTKPPQS